MAQPRGRTQNERVKRAWHQPDVPSYHSDPIFDTFLEGDWEGSYEVTMAQVRIQEMRSWGVNVTPEIARNCFATQLADAHRHRQHQDRQERRALAHQHPAIVYYMRLGNLVKIGFTENLTQRLSVINPEEVLTTEPGGRKREGERHKQFADLRVHGEWFRLEGALVEHIEAVKREAAGE